MYQNYILLQINIAAKKILRLVEKQKHRSPQAHAFLQVVAFKLKSKRFDKKLYEKNVALMGL